MKSKYPINDYQFEEVTILKSKKCDGGWEIERSDGFSFWVPSTCPVEPSPGKICRFYGRGIGSTVRGLFVDGHKAFYRTDAEDKEYRDIEMYGLNAGDWLNRWDAGKGVWSIEMGGLGPGYEQAIQITVAEMLRFMLGKQYNLKLDGAIDQRKRSAEETREAMYKNETVSKLGLSGAQFGAAMNLAFHLYDKGPRAVMSDVAVKDRHIQVSKTFPQG